MEFLAQQQIKYGWVIDFASFETLVVCANGERERKGVGICFRFSSACCTIGDMQGHSVAVIGFLRVAGPKLCTHQAFHLLIMFHCIFFFSNSSRSYEQKKTQSSEEGRQATGIRGTRRRKSAEDASERSSAPLSPEKRGDGNSRNAFQPASSLQLHQSPEMFRTEILVSFGKSRRQFPS